MTAQHTPDHLNIPAKTVYYEQRIKNSRFICLIGHAADTESAQAFIQSIREHHPDANHVCWAFIAGELGQTTALGCSDDGEPAGTAGKPMLNVLQHSGVSEVVAAVVRYFGGTKLGTGGLVRAYSSSVSGAMQSLQVQDKIIMQPLNLQLPYALEDAARRTLAQYQSKIIDLQYSECIQMMIHCPQQQVVCLRAALGNAGHGQIMVLENEQSEP